MDATPTQRSRNPRRKITVTDEPDSGPRLPYLGDQLAMPRPLEHDHDEFFNPKLKAVGHGAKILCHGGIQVAGVLRTRSDDQLLHIEIRRMEESSTFRRCEYGYGVRRIGRTEVRALKRVYSNVDSRKLTTVGLSPGRMCDANLLADVQHGSFVPFPFANNHSAVDGDAVERRPH